MMWYWGSGAHWWGWLLGLVGMVAFWAIVIWAVWYFVSAVNRRSGHDRRPGAAKQILDERLARAEIDAEQYRPLRDQMQGDDRTPAGSGDLR